MSNLKLYCLTCIGCVRFLNENAPILSRGKFRDSWRSADVRVTMSVILTLHKKVRKVFVGCHG